MLLTVYDSNRQAKAVLSPDDSSTQVKAIQSDNVLTLSFTLYEYVALEVNDYVDFEGERYWLQERYLPDERNTQEWKYDVKFYGIESLMRRFLVLNVVDGDPEPVFTLTAPPREHMALIVKSINDGMGGVTDWKVGRVEGTENVVIDYEGKYCPDALKELAGKVPGAEWWVEGQTVNLCRCEYGEEVSLAYGKGLTELSRDKADGAKFYTRLFPIGSSRNIDPEKYGHSRLQLPDGAKYVDVNTEKYGIHHHYEKNAFADIYPRRVGTVTSVRSAQVTDEDGHPFVIWYFRDDTLNFDPNTYELAGKVKRVSFQEGGELAGLGEEEDGTYYFEVNFDSDTREFEIITIWPYDDDTQLPGGNLIPKTGDRYILWNIRMPDEYYALAEEEYLTAVNRYNAENAIDVSVYKGPTDHVYVERNKIDLYPGRRVRLESAEYFPETGFRASRITKITRKVNLPSQVELEIGDALSIGPMEGVNNEIADIKNYTRVLASSLPDIIRSWEKTLPTDNNLFSALKILKEIEEKALSRKKDDTASGLITFLKGLVSDELTRALGGLEVGEAIDSLIAGKGIVADTNGRIQADTLELRNSLVVLELIFNRLSAIESDYSFSESGTIESIELLDDGTYQLHLRKRWENDFTAFRENDIVYGWVNSLASETGEYYASWLRVLYVDTSANIVNAVLYPDNEVPGGKNYPPEPLMVITRRGNPVNEERQSYWYLSSREHCICMLDGVTKPILEESNYSVIIGRLKHLTIFDNLPINYRQSYIYCRGITAQDYFEIDYKGNVARQENNRGLWSASEAVDNPYQSDDKMYDAVYHYGCKWICLQTGATDEPRYGSVAWAMIEGNPEFTIDIESSNGWYFDVDRFATTLTVTGELYNRDVTLHILDDDIEWTRDTGNVTEDNAWAVAHAGAGKSLPLTVNDLGPDYMMLTGCKFIAKALLRDGKGNYETVNYVTF